MSSSNVIVLSAGGTGGHLFPAQALAGALVRRGCEIVVMTDSRFANYATAFPAARIETVPSSPFNAITAPFKIAAGIVMAWTKLLKLKPARRKPATQFSGGVDRLRRPAARKRVSVTAS